MMVGGGGNPYNDLILGGGEVLSKRGKPIKDSEFKLLSSKRGQHYFPSENISVTSADDMIVAVVILIFLYLW